MICQVDINAGTNSYNRIFSIETIAAMIQPHIASGLLAMVIFGFALLPKRIVVNLALVDVSKEEDILTY